MDEWPPELKAKQGGRFTSASRERQCATYVHQLLPHLWSESRLIRVALASGMDGQGQPEKYKKPTTDFIESAPGSG